MRRLMIRCPLTERLVPTGRESDGGPGFRRSLPGSDALSCLACDRTHTWYREEVVVEGRERRDRPEIAGWP